MIARPNLIIMAKLPRPGRVKTRLAADLGTIDATWWYRQQLKRLFRSLGRDPRWTTWIAISPDLSRFDCEWPQGVRRIPQGSGHLGARMKRLMQNVPPGPVLLVGSDIPSITPTEIATAFKRLGSGIMFGPAPDGGYWLVGVGQRRCIGPGFLQDVRWSTAHALADSLQSCAREKVRLTTMLQDVDTGADLKSLSS